MDNLLRNRARAAEDARRKRRKIKRKEVVAYAVNGKAIKGKLSKGKKTAVVILSMCCGIGGVIYVPPVFYRAASENTDVPIVPDAAAIKTYQTYLKDNPDMDFDGDGLTNVMEAERNTDPWNMDTDGDGVSDYAELYLTETSPTDASSIMVQKVMDEDEKEGSTLGTPYKIDDIIFWPDSYAAKTYGAVVRTLTGYRFCHYTGWVRFPQTVYAYQYENGIHSELKHREAEDAWKIESSDEIVLYDSPLKFVHCLKLPIAGTIYLEDNAAGRFLSKILPDKGWFTCYRAAAIDTQPEAQENTTASLRQPLINKNDISRFGKNMNTLKDLSWVRKLIEADECVAVSLYSGNAGESIGIVYGYTKTGDLLVADESLNPVGVLKIKESAKKMMDKEGTIGQISYFDFEGLGFDSRKYGDRICFFSSTLTSGGDMQAGEEAVQEETQPETELETEPSTEAAKQQTEEETADSETEHNAVVTFGF